MTLTPTLAVLLLAAAPAFSAPDASFDQGVDVSALASQAKMAAAKDTTKTQSMMGMRYDMSCTNIVFHAGDKPTSNGVWLKSQEWDTQCQYVGAPPYGSQQCWDVPGNSWSQQVTVTISNPQPLLPWEQNVFRVCLQGPWLTTDPVQAAYSFKVVSDGYDTGGVVVSAGARTPEAPDPVGVTGQLNAQLHLQLTDKWSTYYKGEQTVVKVELKKHVDFWPDESLIETSVTLPVAASYDVDLNRYAAQFSQKPASGSRYYVEYSVERVGSVSSAEFTPELKTAQVSYAPGALAFAR